MTRPPGNPPPAPAPQPAPGPGGPSGPGRTSFRIAFVAAIAVSVALTSGPASPMATEAWSVVFAAALGWLGFRFVRSFRKAGQW